jgi:hypothetical protein
VTNATIIDAIPFDAILSSDGCLQVTVRPEDIDDVLVQIEGVIPETVEADLNAAFAELARQIAAKVRIGEDH